MATYQQSRKLDHVRYELRGGNLREAMKLEAQGHEILRLNIGNPAPFGFDAPPLVEEGLRDHLHQAQGYSDSRGILPAREAVAAYYQGHHLDIGVDDIILGNGVSELIVMVLQAMVDDGDEVLIPTPDYPLWTGAASLAGATPVHYLCDEPSGWQPDVADIEAKITDRTKAIVIINPNNPTGAVYTDDVLRQIVDLARKHGLVILSDEIYEKILYDGATHTHTATLCGDDVLCFTYSGLSKAYRVCGYRAGWVAVTGPKAAAESLLAGLNLLASMRLCANVPAQNAIPAALTGPQTIDELVAPGGRLHEQLRVSHELLNQIPGVSCQPARGALYLFPRLDPEVYAIEDDELWARDLLREKHILVSHGTGFNWPRPDHFRLVCLPEADVLAKAVREIGEFCTARAQ